MSPYMQFYWKRSAGQVRRWHTESPIGDPDVVGLHSWGVAMLLLYCFEPQGSSEAVMLLRDKLIVAALLHDVAERFTGDTPAPMKWALGYEAFDKAEETIAKAFGCAFSLNDKEKMILQAADVLESLFASFDQVVRGNSAFIPIFTRISRRFESSGLIKASVAFSDLYDWLCSAFDAFDGVPSDNPFLQELGQTHYYENREQS